MTPLFGLLAVSACAHAGPATGNDRYERRVDLFHRLLSSFPPCDPATVGATDIVAPVGARATVLGTLELATGFCEQRGEVMHPAPPVSGQRSAVERPCWPCEASSFDWRLLPPGAQEEIILFMPTDSKVSIRPRDCDGSAFAAARRDDRTVMVTGHFRGPPAPASASGLMGVTSPRRMEVEAICRVTASRP